MFLANPFSQLTEFVDPLGVQAFVLLLLVLVVFGTLFDIIHKKNVKYFFENLKKSKKSAIKILSTSEKTSIIAKTVTSDILTTSELNGKRRLAHLLGMYGTLIFWITSGVMIFCYLSTSSDSPFLYPLLWHIGSIMTIIGGCWFWFFLRVDVSAEAYPWYRCTKADLFVLSLIITQSSAFIWSFSEYFNIYGLNTLFLLIFILSNLVLFGGVYWSKFAHMFYKPGAAIQKNLSEADGSRDNLPLPSEAPKKYGLGIKRESPKHY